MRETRRLLPALALSTTTAAALAGIAHRRRQRRARRFRVRSEEPLAAGMRRALVGRLDAALDALERADDRGAAVHDARKAIKRARSVLRLVRAQIGEGRFALEDGRLRAVGHTLAPLRSADALARTLNALAERDGGAIGPDELAQTRGRLRGGLATDGSVIARASGQLRQVRESVCAWPALDERAAAADAIRAVRRARRRGRRRWRRALADPSPERLHAWRRRVNELRHEAELLREADRKRLRALARRARDLADVLGEDHDLAELDQLAGLPATVRDAIARRRGELRESAFAIGDELYGDGRRPLAKRLRRRVEKRTCWSR